MSAFRHLAVALAAVLLAGHGPGRSEEASACAFAADDVIGDWILPAPGSDVVENDAREFAIERDGESRVFREYLHHRPMGDGTWHLDAASCILTLDYGDHDETLRVEGEGEGEAHLVDEAGQIYRRFTESES